MKPVRNPTKILTQRQWVCSSCIQRGRQKSGLSVHARKDKLQREGRRWKYGEKLEAAEWDWKKRAEEISEGKRESMLTILEKRGLVDSVTGDRGELDRLMNERRIGAYAGIDPTAPSIHVGHLLPLMTLLWLYLHGFQAVTLLGGSTAQIGDPTGRLTDRGWTTRAERQSSMASMHLQLKKFWENMVKHAHSRYGYEEEWAMKRGLVNNNMWWSNSTTALEFLKYMGTGVRIGPMLSRDTVKNRMKQGEGMSFAEFTYPLMQAWDWWKLFQQRDIQLQIGGADQYGNIVAGIDAVDYAAEQLIDPTIETYKTGPLAKRFGLTVPLLTTSTGEKYGKSMGNAVFLDPEIIPIFEQYQFFQRSSDEDVGRHLRLFTLVPLPEIEELLEYHKTAPHERKPQNRLAYEVMALLHGPIEADKVLEAHKLLFGRKPTSAPGRPKRPFHAKDESDISPILNPNVPQTNSATPYLHHVTIPRTLVAESTARVLYAVGLVGSRSEGNRLIQAKGAYVGAQPAGEKAMPEALEYRKIMDPGRGELLPHVIEGSLLILRSGKWNVKIAKILDDEEFDAKGLDVPGWTEFKQSRGKGSGKVEEDVGNEKPEAATTSVG